MRKVECRMETQEISLRELIEIIWRGKWIIAACAIISLLLGTVFTFFIRPDMKQATLVIEINYPGIEKGENPNGTEFDIYLLKAPIIIENALKGLKLENTEMIVNDIRRKIKIQPVVPKIVVDLAEVSVTRGRQFEEYYPNQYKISYNMDKEMSKNEVSRLLEAIVLEYKTYFRDTYFNKTFLNNSIALLDMDKYDYPEITLIFDSQINKIQAFLEEDDIKSSTKFRSIQTGMTFGDINEHLNTLKSVENGMLSDIVNTTNITKKKQLLIMRYRNKIRQLELDRKKKESEYEKAKEMMDIFKKDSSVIIFPRTEDIDAEVISENSVSYYDELAKRGINAAVKAANNMHDIEYYKDEIKELENDMISDEEKEFAINEVEGLIHEIKEKLTNYINVTNVIVEEYFDYTYARAIKSVTAVEINSNRNLRLNMAIALVLGVMIGIFTVFFREYWKNSFDLKAD